MVEYMTSDNVADVFSEMKETLYQVGIEDDFFLDLLAARLLIERIGETGNQDWWESRVLSETGRTRISEVTPKTALKSRISLALKVGRKAESDQLPDDSVSLYSFGPQLESRLEAALEEVDWDDTGTLEPLEELSVRSLTEGWTDEIIERTEGNISSSSRGGSPSDGRAETTIPLDDEGYTQEKIDKERWRILSTLLQGYGSCTDQLRVPYYPLEPELKTNNAG